MEVDEKDKREKYIKLLFELTELQEAFMGLQVLFFNPRFLVVIMGSFDLVSMPIYMLDAESDILL